MKILNSPIKFMIYVTLRAVRHPKTPITYRHCSACKLRFNATECPKCHDKVGQSPEDRQESTYPLVNRMKLED